MLFCALRKNEYSDSRKLIKFSLLALSFVFFIMAMEEVSWFQRILQVETPDTFKENLQGEMNLHNFATSYVENAYYFGAFVFLVVFPFLRFIFPFVSTNEYLKNVIPRPFVAVIGGVACAFNYDMWDVVLTQIAFFGSILVLFVFVLHSANIMVKALVSISILVIIATQILFLINGDKYDRIWEITEYKELLIPISFFIYSISVLVNKPNIKL